MSLCINGDDTKLEFCFLTLSSRYTTMSEGRPTTYLSIPKPTLHLVYVFCFPSFPVLNPAPAEDVEKKTWALVLYSYQISL